MANSRNSFVARLRDVKELVQEVMEQLKVRIQLIDCLIGTHN